jgi:hypothetical protein
MPVTKAKARKLALGLPDTAEAPHFDRMAFRTPRRIFATLAADGASINLMFDAGLQEFWCGNEPASFSPVPGGWGRMGATTCNLRTIDETTLQSALNAAHALAVTPKKNKPRKA